MKNDNNVFQVLVGAGILAKAETVSDLAAGDVGFINVATGAAVDKTDANEVKELQVLGLSPNSGMSVTPAIKLSRLNSITKKTYSAGQVAKVTVTIPATGNDTNAVIEEGDEIGVTFVIQAGDTYQAYGINQLKKHFYVLAGTNKTVTATALAAAINADEESVANGGFMEASASSEVVTITFAFGSDSESIPVLGKLVVPVVSPTSIVANDNITGTVTPAFAFAQGKGKYIQSLEKEAAPYAGKSKLGDYRYIPDNPEFVNFVPDAAATSNYDLYILNYDLDYAQNSGYNDNFEVVVAAVTGSATSTAINDLLYNVSTGKKIGLSEPEAEA